MDKNTDEAGEKAHASQGAANPFTRALDDHVARAEEMVRQMDKMQEQGVRRATEAIDEAAKLTKAAIEYASKLSSEWRQMALEGARQGARSYGSGRTMS